MKATKTLPDAYMPYRTLHLAQWQITVATNVAGLVLLIIFGWLFMGVAAALHPRSFVMGLAMFGRTLTVVEFILTMLAVVILHEFIHAFFFWFFTRERPKIGFNLLYAYAAAPDWYFPRRQFLVIALAPFLLITIVGLVLMPWANFMAIPRLVLALTVNAAGAVGDLIVAVWLFSQSAIAFVRDQGATITSYHKTGPLK
jgi:hypothetical protein